MTQKIRVKFKRLASVGNFSNLEVGCEIEEDSVQYLQRRRKREELWRDAREFVNAKLAEEKRNSLASPKGPSQRGLDEL
jgi:hypothetical protein